MQSTVPNRAMTEESMLPINSQTVATLWRDLKTMYHRDDVCKSYARQQVNEGRSGSAEWAFVIEILEGRMDWNDELPNHPGSLSSSEINTPPPLREHELSSL